MILEIAENSVNEALDGYCDTVKVKMFEDNVIEVADNGRGLPVEFYKKAGKSKLEVILTGNYIRGELTDGIYKLSRKKYKGGLASVNGLSDIMEITVIKEGKIWYQKYHRGIAAEDIKQTGEAPEDVHGTTIRFRPDAEIFGKQKYDYEILFEKLNEIKGIKINLYDKRDTSVLT